MLWFLTWKQCTQLNNNLTTGRNLFSISILNVQVVNNKKNIIKYLDFTKFAYSSSCCVVHLILHIISTIHVCFIMYIHQSMKKQGTFLCFNVYLSGLCLFFPCFNQIILQLQMISFYFIDSINKKKWKQKNIIDDKIKGHNLDFKKTKHKITIQK